MATRIILADDHPFIVAGVQALLQRESGIEVVARAASPDALMDVLAVQECDLLVTDLNMSSTRATDGLHMIQTIQRRWPELPIIVLTQQGGAPVIHGLLQLQVRSIVHKLDALAELPAAVTQTINGMRYLSTHVSRVLVESSPIASASCSLSQREADVLRLFASGKTVTDIAGIMNRSVKTVSGHKISVMTKLSLSTDRELYEYARQQQLAR